MVCRRRCCAGDGPPGLSQACVGDYVRWTEKTDASLATERRSAPRSLRCSSGRCPHGRARGRIPAQDREGKELNVYNLAGWVRRTRKEEGDGDWHVKFTATEATEDSTRQRLELAERAVTAYRGRDRHLSPGSTSLHLRAALAARYPGGPMRLDTGRSRLVVIVLAGSALGVGCRSARPVDSSPMGELVGIMAGAGAGRIPTAAELAAGLVRANPDTMEGPLTIRRITLMQGNSRGGGYPNQMGFDYSGGELLVYVAGTAHAESQNGVIGVSVTIDNSEIGEATMYAARPQEHYTLVPTFLRAPRPPHPPGQAGQTIKRTLRAFPIREDAGRGRPAPRSLLTTDSRSP